ncbi:hypothetical protein [Hyphomicrobium zavarzinii]|uniref:hypothetical protein n=1 Tax=Hyphomicrobium zavarzinii TaxID=48292 RepID=UPI001FD952C4|nr:hypothetical protein [Hyphomicrobium zavarzinii]
MRHASKLWLSQTAAALLGVSGVQAGQDANFILYNQHMEEKGALDVEVYSDFSHVGDGEANYTAQLFEIEYGVTDLFTTAIYLEGVKNYDAGENYDFGSFRFENRFRLFRGETLLNPVLYAEYEYKKPNSRFIRSVVGRTDGEEEEAEAGEEESEHELESKLILGRDLTSNLNVAFNTIQEVNFGDGLWSFGYAAGLNYVFFRAYEGSEVSSTSSETGLEKMTLGVELYGGLGDSHKGLTLNGSSTEQYAGINLRFDCKNETHFGVGGAFGLTDDSEDAILRLTAGYEFE